VHTFRASLELGKFLRHRQRMAQKLIALGKFEVVNHVDQYQGDACLSGALPCRSSFPDAILPPRL
jgi:hypothetical protein